MTDDLAERLLAAQIAYAKRELLTPECFHRLVVDEIEAFLDGAAQITLNEAVTPEMIKNTAHKYAVQMPLEGSIPELAGEIAGRLYRHPVNDSVRLADVMDARRFDELVSGIAETEALHRLVRQILGSPVAVDACVGFIGHAVDNMSRRPTRPPRIGDGHPRAGLGVGPAMRRRLSAMLAPMVPAVSAGVEKLTRAGARYVLESASAEGDEVLIEAAHEFWRHRADDSVGWFREVVTAEDVDDAVVLVVEFWKMFRDTDYFRALLDEGIDHVFDKYGDVLLVDLLADLGVGRADLIEEGLRFGPPVLARLDEEGLLDAALHRLFAPFYASAEFRDAVAGLDG
ncbi:MAG: hypothetical protein QM662_18825 [Gordonia sp. (in: high G+C Gram-positive bacteria)]